MYLFFSLLLFYNINAMKRSQFLRNVALSLPVIGTLSLVGTKKSEANTTQKQVGFEHLPEKGGNTMKKVVHPSKTRGHANHGWLKTHHSFSFANYYNPERMHFGVLRVLNDDFIAGGGGFPTHPHDNMEIITIPFEGDLAHKDSMGNSSIIKEGDIQVMSAGTGIQHSEYNANRDKAVKLFQIWLFPKKRNVTPRYDQRSLKELEKKNEFYQVLSPNEDDAGVWIHQDAWFNLGKFDQGVSKTYSLHRPKSNGIYVIAIDGKVKVGDEELNERDAVGIWEQDAVSIEAIDNAHFLIMELPMELPRM